MLTSAILIYLLVHPNYLSESVIFARLNELDES